MSASITLGVCAMAKKTSGKPMREILRRLEDAGFTINVFEERAILEDPIEEWPVCDCMIAFFSAGFPLAKAEAYSDLRKPFVVNDLHLQWTLMDRIKMYELLKKHNVPVPKHVIVDHANPDHKFVCYDDHIECNGVKLKKPLVEKPRDGDDHNVHIYWPHSSGGGCTNLFRKVGDCSSKYVDGVRDVRTDGVYIYEEFVNTAGVDVKVYTCGPDYAHAEARKAPAMDGRVTRNERGKEERYPVILSEAEKSIARTVVLAFKQNICGLDLLRSKSGSVVCDVNGWSFVKDSAKYWDDTAQTLAVVCRTAIARMRTNDPENGCLWGAAGAKASATRLTKMPSTLSEDPRSPRSPEKLLCVSIIARHADRTPKQKMKMVTRHPALLAFCDVKSKDEEVKLKQTEDLQKLLEVSRMLLEEGKAEAEADLEDLDGARSMERLKLEQLRQVLEMSPLEGASFYRKVQLKPKKMDAGSVSEMQLILKWGGKLTWAGKNQCIDLGHELRRVLYPARDCAGVGAGGSLLRLHATYRHDLKIYTSDEGRVILSAAAFVKGLLDLDGALPPITAMMLQSDEAATQMLDIMPDEGRVRMDAIKAELSNVLHEDPPPSKEVVEDDMFLARLHELGGEDSSAHQRMRELHQWIIKLVDELSERWTSADGLKQDNAALSRLNNPHTIVPHMNHSTTDPVENLKFVYTRWHRLKGDYYDAKKKKFDISKIPDIYDSSLYDVLHNLPLQLKHLPDLHQRAQALAKFMVPLEYGITKPQKSLIGTAITNRLLRKIYGDLHKEVDDNDESEYKLDHLAVNDSDIRQIDRRVHTRLYFTSESHIISLLNVLRWGHIRDGQPEGLPLLSPEAAALFDTISADGMAFLTHLVLTVHESSEYPEHSFERFRIRILFSPGANAIGLEVMKAVPLTPPEGLPLAKVALFFNDVLGTTDAQWDPPVNGTETASFGTVGTKAGYMRRPSKEIRASSLGSDICGMVPEEAMSPKSDSMTGLSACEFGLSP